jgi:prophage DNA circulation protein
MDILSVYDTLLDASLGGVPFDIIDSRDEAGRRIERILFPGQPRSAWQDLGQLDGDIQINGVLIGDDFAAQAALMRNVFIKAGAATLVHPWLGQMLVMLPKPLETSFAHDELRVARISFSCVPFLPRQPYVPDTLETLLQAIAALQLALDAALQQILAPLITALTVINAVEGFCASLAHAWGIAVQTSSMLVAAVVGAVEQLIALPALISPTTYAAEMVSVLSAPSAAIAAASVTVPPAVIAPGGATTAAAVVDPTVAVTAILAVVVSMPGLAGPVAPMPAVAAAAQMLAICDAITTASDIVFVSQQQAEAMRDRLIAALDAAAMGIATASALAPIAVGPAWRAAQTVRAAVVADYSTMIGRLPPVITITPPGSAPIWLIAQYLSGDTPTDVVATYLDLVMRNGIVHPAMPPAGPLETIAS